jgi:hypothetical protein
MGAIVALSLLVVLPEPNRIQAPVLGGDNSPEAIEKAADRGAATAARDIWAGRPVILVYGRAPLEPSVDKTTGLRRVVVAGCLVSPAFAAEVDAYNDAVHDWYWGEKPTKRGKPPHVSRLSTRGIK